jgi:hypothetical protein
MTEHTPFLYRRSRVWLAACYCGWSDDTRRPHDKEEDAKIAWEVHHALVPLERHLPA